jgi:hypothetical protein
LWGWGMEGMAVGRGAGVHFAGVASAGEGGKGGGGWGAGWTGSLRCNLRWASPPPTPPTPPNTHPHSSPPPEELTTSGSSRFLVGDWGISCPPPCEDSSAIACLENLSSSCASPGAQVGVGVRMGLMGAAACHRFACCQQGQCFFKTLSGFRVPRGGRGSGGAAGARQEPPAPKDVPEGPQHLEQQQSCGQGSARMRGHAWGRA